MFKSTNFQLACSLLIISILFPFHLAFAQDSLSIEGNDTTVIKYLPQQGAFPYAGDPSLGKLQSRTVIQQENFNEGNIIQPLQLISGRAVGLSITRPGSDINEPFDVRIRGASTLFGSSQPLIIIDGMIGASLESIDPMDIAAITVLKDAAATAIYGIRASHGVLIIETIKGNQKGPNVRFNSFISTDRPANLPRVLGREAFLQEGGQDFGSETDWINEVIQNTFSYTSNLSVSGQEGNLRYGSSINYRNNEGLVKNSSNERMNARLFLEHQSLNDRLTLSGQLSYTQEELEKPSPSLINNAMTKNPTAPIFDPSPVAQEYGGYFQSSGFFRNPIAQLDQQYFRDENQFSMMQFNASFEVHEQFSLHARYGNDRQNLSQGSVFGKQDFEFGRFSGGRMNLGEFDINNQLMEFFGNFHQNLGQGTDLHVMMGTSYQSINHQGTRVTGSDFIFDPRPFEIDLARSVNFDRQNIRNFQYNEEILSFFGRAHFQLINQFHLGLSLRSDDYSGFGEDVSPALIYSLQAAYDFQSLLGIRAIDHLNLRAGYGVTGNFPAHPNAAFSLLAPVHESDGETSSIQRISDENPSLSWEPMKEFNIGIDFSFANHRVYGSLDYYHRNMEDLMFNFIGSENPFTGNPMVGGAPVIGNFNSMQSSGLEISTFVEPFRDQNLNWTTGLLINVYARPQLGPSSQPGLSLPEFGFSSAIPFSSPFILYRFRENDRLGTLIGIDLVEVAEDGTPTFDPSLIEIVQQGADLLVQGNGLPTGELGWINNFQYGRLEVSALLRGTWGHQLLNHRRHYFENQSSGISVNRLDVADPISFSGFPGYAVNHHIENASFLRMENLVFSYTLVKEKNWMEDLRVYLAIQNVFTISSYSGFDPEVRYRRAIETPPVSSVNDLFHRTAYLYPGLDDVNTHFLARTFTLGFTLRL